jgi:predicted oxidoreductase
MQMHNIKPMAWNPLGNIFSEKNEQTKRLLLLLENLSKKYSVETDVILLSWIIWHPSGILPVIGTTNSERIKNSTLASELKLELEDWFKIWTESRGEKVP